MHHMRAWRAKNPMAAAWQTHKQHAKKRGIPVVWTRAEFFEFCRRTSYHLTRKDGMTIERQDARLPYSLSNCTTLTFMENSTKGAQIDKWLKRQPWAKYRVA